MKWPINDPSYSQPPDLQCVCPIILLLMGWYDRQTDSWQWRLFHPDITILLLLLFIIQAGNLVTQWLLPNNSIPKPIPQHCWASIIIIINLPWCLTVCDQTPLSKWNPHPSIWACSSTNEDIVSRWPMPLLIGHYCCENDGTDPQLLWTISYVKTTMTDGRTWQWRADIIVDCIPVPDPITSLPTWHRLIWYYCVANIVCGAVESYCRWRWFIDQTNCLLRARLPFAQHFWRKTTNSTDSWDYYYYYLVWPLLLNPMTRKEGYDPMPSWLKLPQHPIDWLLDRYLFVVKAYYYYYCVEKQHRTVVNSQWWIFIVVFWRLRQCIDCVLYVNDWDLRYCDGYSSPVLSIQFACCNASQFYCGPDYYYAWIVDLTIVLLIQWRWLLTHSAIRTRCVRVWAVFLDGYYCL